jgi:antitoxin ParD1/3/4
MGEHAAMQVWLTPELEAMVRDKVSSGLYANSDEVIREALRLMLAHEELDAAKLQRLREAVAAGEASGPLIDFDFEALMEQLDEEADRAGIP